jgi:hypothetical protein
MCGDELVGVMIGGSEEYPDSPIGYAISADDVCRNISQSMGDVPVRLLTSLENKILAQMATPHGNRLQQLAALRVHQLSNPDAHVGTIGTPLCHQPNASIDVKTGNAALAAFLELGTFCTKLLLRPSLARRYRDKPTLYRNKTEMFDERFVLDQVEGSLTYASKTLGIVPCIFIANVNHFPAKSRFHPYYGDVVACNELSELLENMKTMDDIRPPDDVFFEGSASHSHGLQRQFSHSLLGLRLAFYKWWFTVRESMK